MVTSFSPGDLADQFDIRCAFDYDHYDILLLYTLIPLVFVGFVFILHVNFSARSSKHKQALRRESINTVLYLTFVIYPGVSGVIFATFQCIDFEQADGNEIFKSTLSHDFRISCGSSKERTFALIYASVMVFVFPVGIFLMYAFLLRRYRALVLIQSGNNDAINLADEDKKRLKTIEFLTEPYTKNAYWFEAYELVRKLVQSYRASFIQTSSGDIVPEVISLNFCFIAVLNLVCWKPYKEQGDFWFALISLILLLPMIQVNLVGISRDGFNDASNTIIVLEFVFMFVIALCQGYYNSRVGSNDTRPEYDGRTAPSSNTCIILPPSEEEMMQMLNDQLEQMAESKQLKGRIRELNDKIKEMDSKNKHIIQSSYTPPNQTDQQHDNVVDCENPLPIVTA
mmetsp:Transcript_36862/g.46175  ORF Transcript_36862/g.46175 Transcript_36862/m.46175 type:complete len:397 (+) Transcript_36862:1455-2645(+)